MNVDSQNLSHFISMISKYCISANSFLPWIVNSFHTFMYCHQKSQYIRPNSKKNSFHGNYSRKYGKWKVDHKEKLQVLFLYISKLKVRQSRKVFFKQTILPKNEWTNSLFFCLTVLWLNCFVHFLEEFEDSKKSFRN